MSFGKYRVVPWYCASAAEEAVGMKRQLANRGWVTLWPLSLRGAKDERKIDFNSIIYGTLGLAKNCLLIFCQRVMVDIPYFRLTPVRIGSKL